jgi:predicted Fe-Mo cluster-binding NifX family protein
VRAALTVWDGRISPVFDVSRKALILTVENGTETARRIEDIETPNAELKLDRLMELGVDTLICGAISEPLHYELSTRGVKVIAFVAGEVDEIVKTFLAGALPTPALSMPGCFGRRNRFRRGRGRAGGRGGGWGRTGHR